MNSEEANIAIETLKLAQSLATLPATKLDIGRAIEWAEQMAKNESLTKPKDSHYNETLLCLPHG